jgi:flavin-dependent dehydrogenase
MTAAPSSGLRAANDLIDHLVIGGGPAGAMVAVRLAFAGRAVVLVEKEPGPHHKVCGEFLSAEAIAYLHQVGIAPHDLGAAVIRSVRLAAGDKLIEAPLPFQALSLSRRVLDEALLRRTEESGCLVLRGVAVKSLTSSGGKWPVTLDDGQSLRASNLFLATGKHDLRGFVRAPARQTNLVGFKLHWQLEPTQVAALSERMNLYLFPGGYGGISLVENSIANLCLVVRRSVLRELGGWPQLLAFILRGNRHLHSLLEGATPLAPRPLAISPIPYGYLAADFDGLWRVGDQAAVIPSFTGDGMSIALHSASLAAQMFLAGKSAADYTAALRVQLSRQMTLATWLSRVAVTRAGRAAAFAVLPLAPSVLRRIAASTRIASSSLVDAEVAAYSEPQTRR